MFRDEARLAQQDRLHGDVSIALPLSWQLIGFGFLAFLGVAVTFMFLGSYARVETVSGQIVPDLGSAQIIASRSGIVADMTVRDGQHVRIGQHLISVRVEEATSSGGSNAYRDLVALSEQDAHLAAQQRSTLGSAQAGRQRLLAQAAGIRAAIESLRIQIATQQTLIDVAKADYDRSQGVASKGFLSKRELQTRQETLLGRQQQLATLSQSLFEKQASLSEAGRSADEADRNAEATVAGLAGERASVTQRRFDIEASRGYTLVAPIAGVVTAVTARIGQTAQSNSSLMTIVPAGAKLEAQLYVPTQAAGFLNVGEEVRLQIDAFPFSRFGTVPARIDRISTAAVVRSIGNGQSTPVYLVSASIADPRVYGFGRMRALQPDMTLTARIVAEKRSLAEWLFEPILAVRRR